MTKNDIYKFARYPLDVTPMGVNVILSNHISLHFLERTTNFKNSFLEKGGGDEGQEAQSDYNYRVQFVSVFIFSHLAAGHEHQEEEWVEYPEEDLEVAMAPRVLGREGIEALEGAES